MFSQASVRSHLWGGGIWLTGGLPPSQIRTGDYPFPDQDRGLSLPRSGWEDTPFPRSGWEVPHPRFRMGVPPSAGWGTPPGQDRGYHIPGQDRGLSLPRSGWEDTPFPRSGWEVPHPRSGWGYPPQ